MTGGAYHLAESSTELREVYENLPTQWITVTATTEISAMCAAVAALLVMLAIVLSIIWNPLQ
ncbi:MAG: hypothetical protein QY332_11400 [Anaerolineales bacterium]|nr:MAG: hypothetical protein QY332_11400 [Anaerolineales bacterium]